MRDGRPVLLSGLRRIVEVGCYLTILVKRSHYTIGLDPGVTERHGSWTLPSQSRRLPSPQRAQTPRFVLSPAAPSDLLASACICELTRARLFHVEKGLFSWKLEWSFFPRDLWRLIYLFLCLCFTPNEKEVEIIHFTLSIPFTACKMITKNKWRCKQLDYISYEIKIKLT